jgi:tape measure domain-containing protein
MDIASLGIAIDSRQARTAQADLDRLTGAGTRAERALGGVGAGGRAAAAGSAQVAASSNTAASSLNAQAASAQRVTAMIRTYAATVAGAFGVREVIQAADSWQSLENRLRLVTQTNTQLQASLSDVYSIAQRTSSGLDSVAQVYQRFAQNAGQLGLSMEQVAAVTETVGKAVAISGASAQAADAALMQFGQALASGVLRGEEFNSIMEQTPGLMAAIAKGMGVPLGAMRDLAADGAITSEKLIKALQAVAGSVDEQFNTRVKTLSNSFTELGNSLTKYIGELNTSAGLTSTIGRALEALSNNVDTLLAGATSLVAINLAGWLGASATAAGGLSGALLAASRSAQAFFASLGPVGWAILAIGAGVSTLILFSDEIKKATATTRELGAIWDTLGDAASAAIDGILSGLEWLGDKTNQFFSLFTFGSDGATESMRSGFAEAAIASARAIDEMYAGMLGNFAALGGGLRALWDNFKTLADYAIKSAQSYFQEFIFSVKDTLNGLGADFALEIPIEAPNFPELKNIFDEAEKSFNEAAKPLGAVDALVRNLEDAELRDAVLGWGDAYDQATKATDKYVASVKGKKKALTEAEKAAQAFAREREQYLKGMYGEISSLSDQADKLEDQVRYYGLSESALNDLTIARLEEQKAALMGIEGAEEEIAIRERMIEQYQRMGVAMRGLEAKEAEKASWEQWSRDVEGIFQQVSQSLTDAIFEGGKSGRDLVKDLFKTLTLRVLINPVMNSIQGAVTNSLGGVFGFNNPQQGAGGANVLGMAQNAQSMYSAYSGGLSSTLGQGASWLGKQIGSEALSSFGLGLTGSAGAAGTVAGITSIGTGLGASLGASIGTSAASMATTTFSASLAGTSAAATAGTVGSTVGAGAAGAGMSLGAAIPYVGLAIGAASLLSGLFGDREPTTRRGQWEWAEMSGGDWSMKYRDSRQPAGTGDAITQYARSAVDSANSMFGKLGVNAAIEHFYATTNSSLKGDRNGVASGGTIRAGDSVAEFGLMGLGGDRTKYGYGGWSKEEMLPRLQTDIQLSILEAFQTQVDSLPKVLADMIGGVNIRALDAAGANAIAEQFNAIITGVDMFREAAKTLPFEQLSDLSFDAAASLLQLSGGLEGLMGGLNTYYENFYSEAERYEAAVGNLGKALGGVGVELPKMVGSADEMKAAYRALVEAQDLNTEAGQKSYTMLIQSSGAFAELATYAGQAAEAVAAAAAAEAMEAQRLAGAIRREELDARRAIEKAQQEAFEASLKAYEEGAKPFEELRATLLLAGDAAGLLGATIERALSNPTGKYMAGGVEYDQPRWGADTTAAGFNYDWGVMQMRLARDLSDEVSANALRIENAGQALTGLAPNLSEYGPVVGPMAQALTAAIVEASGDMGYAVRDSVYQAMLGVAQQDVYGQFASQGVGLAGIRYAQQQASFVSQAGWVAGIGMQFGADVVAYGNALDKLTGRMQSGQITADQFDAAVDALNRTMPTAVELLGDTEAQLARIESAAHEVAMAGARSIDHYFGELRKMAQELEKTEEPINIATAAIGRMNSWVSAFGESAQAAGDYSKRTPEAALIADAAGIAASVLTTADARKAAEALAKDAAFAGVGGAELRNMALLVDGIRAFDPTSWENAFIRISDALGQGRVDEGQYAALFNYSLDVFEDTARATEQVTASFDRLRNAAKSLADELLLDSSLSTLSMGQQLSEAQRQYDEVMRRAMGGDTDASGDLSRVTRNFLELSAESRDEVAYRRNFARSVSSLRQIEQSNPMTEMSTEIKRLNSEIEGLRADLRAANATVASNTGETARELRRISATGIKVQA